MALPKDGNVQMVSIFRQHTLLKRLMLYLFSFFLLSITLGTMIWSMIWYYSLAFGLKPNVLYWPFLYLYWTFLYFCFSVALFVYKYCIAIVYLCDYIVHSTLSIAICIFVYIILFVLCVVVFCPHYGNSSLFCFYCVSLLL